VFGYSKKGLSNESPLRPWGGQPSKGIHQNEEHEQQMAKVKAMVVKLKADLEEMVVKLKADLEVLAAELEALAADWEAVETALAG